MGSKSSPPPAPDYTGAAQATAASNQAQNTAQTFANRPNMTTPWGTSTWTPSQTIDPATGQAVTTWANNVQLTPDQQEALVGQMRLQNARTGTAESLLSRAQSAFQTPFSTDGMAQYYQPTGPAQLNTSGGPSANINTSGGSTSTFNTLSPRFERMQGGDQDTSGGSTNQFSSALPNFREMQGGNQDTSGGPTERFLGSANFDRVQAGSLDTSGGPNQQFNSQSPQFERLQGGGGGVAPIDNSQNLRTNVAAPGSYSAGAAAAIQQRMQPLQDRQRAQLQTQLAIQGVPIGSEAYRNAMDDIGRQENDARLASISQGYAQGNNEFQQDLAGGQFTNSAIGQQFGQRATQAQLGNQVAQFNTTSRQSASNANNANAQQRFANDAQRFSINDQIGNRNYLQRNAATQGNITNSLNATTANNALSQLGFTNDLQRFNVNDSIGNRNYTQANQARQFNTQANQAANAANNASAQQNFANQLGVFNTNDNILNRNYLQGNAARQFNTQANQAATAANNASSQQGYTNAFNQFGLNDAIGNRNYLQANQAAQQQYQNQNQQYLQGNLSRIQQQDAGQNYGAYQSQLRGQQMQEALMLRNMPLNEMNAFLTGQQVQAPQFQGPNPTANRADGTNYLGAAQMQGNYDLQSQGQNNGLMSGLFGLGSAFAGSNAGSAALARFI